MSPQNQRLQKAGDLSDIIYDFDRIRRVARFISASWMDRVVLPIVEADGETFHAPEHVLNSLLMLYRRAFVHGQRFKIPDDWVPAALTNLVGLHSEGLLGRANNVVAHAIHACSSTTAKFVGGSIRYCPVRPGYNQFDFDNLVAIVERWLPFLQAKLEELEKEIRDDPPDDDQHPNEVFFAPLGSRVQLQSLKTGRPQERTRNILRKQQKSEGSN